MRGDMYMIVNATYTIQMTIVWFQHAPDIFEQLFPVGFVSVFSLYLVLKTIWIRLCV